MAPLPKRRHSTRRGGKRKASITLNLATLTSCGNCGAKKLQHRVCVQCGFYGGEALVIKKEKIKKKK